MTAMRSFLCALIARRPVVPSSRMRNLSNDSDAPFTSYPSDTKRTIRLSVDSPTKEKTLMRYLALTLAIVLVAALAGTARASDRTARATFVAGVKSFVNYKPTTKSAIAAERSKAEAATLTVLRTKLAVDTATSPKAKLGRSLGMQAFTKLIAALNANAAFNTALANGQSIVAPAVQKDEARYIANLDSARRLLAAAAKSFGIKLP